MNEKQDIYTKHIRKELDYILEESNLPSSLSKNHVGKVRDLYSIRISTEDKSENKIKQERSILLMVVTDRLSVFDRYVCSIPFKGAVLNMVSHWWFSRTQHIIANHLFQPNAPPLDPNVDLCRECDVFPVEIVVRGYLAGSGSSLWRCYERGERSYCGICLPEGLRKNQKLETLLVTPTTKAPPGEKDIPLTVKELIFERRLMSERQWNFVASKAVELFRFGQQVAAEHNLILADSKYEFGKLKLHETPQIAERNHSSKQKDKEIADIVLVDELHTPDSSRFWLASTYDQRLSENQEPDALDKDLLRRWYSEKSVSLEIAPPEELRIRLAKLYIEFFEKLTGQLFPFAECSLYPGQQSINARIMEKLIIAQILPKQ